MQVGPCCRPRFAALLLVVLMVSGCGQKGSLYRDDAAPQAGSASVEAPFGQAGTSTDDEASAQR
ncbi:lipoprotein [Marinobacter sp.]|uniref:LPS translocon maturation chaperone LptM n=1 Tax=Marinobacter sp. TaxID=50741 RepID=UPI0025BD3E0D|nr:lipoprotein [Marinobacter sp.]